jgi:hypothetical protein
MPFGNRFQLSFFVSLTPSSIGGKFTPSSMGGSNAVFFDIFADAYPARKGEGFSLSGLVTCRFGRSGVVVVDNLPLSKFLSLAEIKHLQNHCRHPADKIKYTEG